MDIPTRRIPHQKFVEWVQVSKHSKISNPAPVYSLDVERYHNYIAEKQVVMNCIYSFKGATPDAFLKPELPHEQIRVLSQSYRLPRAVHAFAEKWIRRVTERMEKRYAPTDQEGEIKRNNHASWLHPDRLLTEIIQEIDEGRRVMILTSCSFMLSPVIKMLRNAGIPFCNPFQRKRGYWNPLRSGKGMSMRERLLALLRINEEVYGSDSRMWTRRELSKIIDVIDAKSGVLVRGAKTRAAKLAKLDGRLEVTAGELTSVFDPEAFDRFMWQTDCSHADWLERHMLKSKAKTMQYPLTIFRKRGIKALQDMPQVILGTIHSAKGGEADVVYIFPDLSRAGVLEYHKSRQGKEAVMRQFYVGFTRAKRRLVLCQAASELAVQF